MAEHGPQVFISYHRADLPVAERVRAHLMANHVKTWMDHYDIPAGTYWPDEIDEGLTQSDLVVGILSPDSVASRNVKNEWDWAIQNDKQLILLMARPCVIPHRYVSINFIDTTRGDLSDALGELMRVPELRAAPGALELPKTRYARSGEVNVAYQTFGEGEVDLVIAPGAISHVEYAWELPGLATYYRRMASFSRVLLFDKRGTGMSDRTGQIATLEERMDDIRAVMDAGKSDRAVIMGVSEGVPLSILFAATYPQRTQALILYGGSATYVQQPDYPWAKPLAQRQHEIEDDAKTLYETWGTAPAAHEWIRLWGAPSQQDDEALVTWAAEMVRLGASPGAAIALDRMNLEVDVRHVLPTIRVPALVLNRSGDHSVDIGEARYLAAHIPGAVLEELPGEDHFPWVGDQDALFAAIERFIATSATETPGEELETALATLVHLVGDDAYATALAAAASHASSRFKGRVVSADERGIEAIFDGPARAIRFADAVVAAVPHSSARGGIQIGEMEIGVRGVAGPPCDAARQLAHLAQPAQILVSGTVRDLVAGSGILFESLSDDQDGRLANVSQVLEVDRGSLG